MHFPRSRRTRDTGRAKRARVPLFLPPPFLRLRSSGDDGKPTYGTCCRYKIRLDLGFVVPLGVWLTLPYLRVLPVGPKGLTKMVLPAVTSDHRLHGGRVALLLYITSTFNSVSSDRSIHLQHGPEGH